MKNLRQGLVIVIIALFAFGFDLTGQLKMCQSSTTEFTIALLSRDYDKAVTYFDFKNPEFSSQINLDTLKASMPRLRERLSKNFGDSLRVVHVSAKKIFTTANESNRLPPYAIEVKATFEGDTHFGYLLFILNEKNGKILNVNIDDFKEPKPNKNNVYIFAIIGLLVVAFNLYMLIKVLTSNIIEKWKRIVMIVLLNAPSLGYNAVSGFYFKLLTFQILGAGFSFTGYESTYCVISIPIGALLVWWKMKNDMYFTEEP